MLANVLGVYLDNIKERELDLPFIAFLHAVGFYDIHFTHGNVEFGKDFIAKLDENGQCVQYSFQTKAGDISQAEWRNNVMGQMLESTITALSHPAFAADTEHQAILVVTGRLLGNAALGLQELNRRIETSFGKRPIILWDREALISKFKVHGLEGVFQATADGFASYGDFYHLYGNALLGKISQWEIEKHSRRWLNYSIDPKRRLLCSVLESDIIAGRCQNKGMLYEAVCAYLTVIRTILLQLHDCREESDMAYLTAIYKQTQSRVVTICHQFVSAAEKLWSQTGKDLASKIPGMSKIITYPIQCARILEVAGYLYFAEQEQTRRDKVARFIKEFASREPGCSNIPSDRYAISLVLPLLALCYGGFSAVMEEVLCKAAIWLCDRYMAGFGLADYSSTEYEEIATLLGYPFESIETHRRSASFAASILGDLAAFVGNETLYSNIINDIKAAKIAPRYWQVSDGNSLYEVEGRDVITYPNIDYDDALTPFLNFTYAEHIRHEPRSFSIVSKVGPLSLMALMLLLRDRYFPTVWPSMMT
jgi:hypothetical protein